MAFIIYVKVKEYDNNSINAKWRKLEEYVGKHLIYMWNCVISLEGIVLPIKDRYLLWILIRQRSIVNKLTRKRKQTHKILSIILEEAKTERKNDSGQRTD